MKFAFSKRYRFECKQCGVCCLQKALSLTESEYKRFKGIVNRSQYEDVRDYHLIPDIHMYDVSFKGKGCHFLRKLNKERACGLYESRFITCRPFPLHITALPDGELLVNLMHCNGVSTKQGRIVDESFVRNIVDDVNSRDTSFLPKLLEYRKSYHNYNFHFYTRFDSTDFWTKRIFLKRIFEWFVDTSPKSKSVDVRIRAINEVLSRELGTRLDQLCYEYRVTQPPLIVIQNDMENMVDEIEKGLEKKLYKVSEDVKLEKKEEIKKIFSDKKVEILIDEKVKVVGLDEEITYSTPYLDRISIKARNLFTEKYLSNDALQLFEDYMGEVLSRVGHGGFPIDIPIIDMLESLYRYSRNVLTTAKIYSRESIEIEEKHINDAIIYLDTRFVLKPTYQRVVKDHTHQRSPFPM